MPVTLDVVAGMIAILLLLICSGLISASEISYFSLPPALLREFRSKTTRRHRLLLQHLEDPKRLLATILISNNFVNVAVVLLSTYFSNKLFDVSGHPVLAFVIQVIIISLLILLIGEIVPKIYGVNSPEKVALFMAIPLDFLSKMFYPLSSLLTGSTSLIDRRMNKKRRNISINDLSDALDVTTDGNTPEEETRMLKDIVRFGNIDVKEIMKSRVDVTAVDQETTYPELLKQILDSGYSRIPVYKDTFDHVTGILYIKDLLSHMNKPDDFAWQTLPRDAYFVPENKKINDLLQEFREKKMHFAVVVDEYGGTSGIVTLEDIIEEIVGEINDEFDTDSDHAFYTQLDPRNYIFEAKITLHDFCKVIGAENNIFESVKGESDSLAGLILELMGKIPGKDETITYKDFVFTILQVDNRRIRKIQVMLPENL